MSHQLLLNVKSIAGVTCHYTLRVYEHRGHYGGRTLWVCYYYMQGNMVCGQFVISNVIYNVSHLILGSYTSEMEAVVVM